MGLHTQPTNKQLVVATHYRTPRRPNHHHRARAPGPLPTKQVFIYGWCIAALAPCPSSIVIMYACKVCLAGCSHSGRHPPRLHQCHGTATHHLLPAPHLSAPTTLMPRSCLPRSYLSTSTAHPDRSSTDDSLLHASSACSLQPPAVGTPMHACFCRCLAWPATVGWCRHAGLVAAPTAASRSSVQRSVPRALAASTPHACLVHSSHAAALSAGHGARQRHVSLGLPSCCMRGGHLPGREQQPQTLACLKPALEP
jgi:hypothetical protein